MTKNDACPNLSWSLLEELRTSTKIWCWHNQVDQSINQCLFCIFEARKAALQSHRYIIEYWQMSNRHSEITNWAVSVGVQISSMFATPLEKMITCTLDINSGEHPITSPSTAWTKCRSRVCAKLMLHDQESSWLVKSINCHNWSKDYMKWEFRLL